MELAQITVFDEFVLLFCPVIRHEVLNGDVCLEEVLSLFIWPTQSTCSVLGAAVHTWYAEVNETHMVPVHMKLGDKH